MHAVLQSMEMATAFSVFLLRLHVLVLSNCYSAATLNPRNLNLLFISPLGAPSSCENLGGCSGVLRVFEAVQWALLSVNQDSSVLRDYDLTITDIPTEVGT